MPLTSKASHLSIVSYNEHDPSTQFALRFEKWIFESQSRMKEIRNEVLQLKFELATFKSIHESLKLEYNINNRVTKNKDKDLSHLRKQLKDSY